jgi:hypothetical protein
LGFDLKRHMHILSGPAVDAVLTPEGKWRTPDGRVSDSVPRKLHVPVYIPEGCKRNISAPGFELKCLGEINIAGRHPSGAEYEFVDGELLEASFERLRKFAEVLGNYGRDEVTFPECKTPRRVDLDTLTELFSRIYSAAQAAGYSRHNTLYDLGILCRLACVPKEDAEEVAKRVYGTAGSESQTLSQRLSHVERAYRASRDGGPKPRSPNVIFDVWQGIDDPDPPCGRRLGGRLGQAVDTREGGRGGASRRLYIPRGHQGALQGGSRRVYKTRTGRLTTWRDPPTT